MPLDYDEINDRAQQFAGQHTKPVPKPPIEFGVDTEQQIIYDLNEVESSRIDTATLNSFTQVSQRRDELYSLIDSMCEDTRLAAALEVYVEDVTERAPSGKIVWAESNDPNITSYINFILDSLNVDKHIYKWAYCLCKYGDVYIRLFRESDTNDPIFDNRNRKHQNERQKLDEAIKVRVADPNDNYVFYCEMVKNPAQVFELMKFGKSAGYIEVPGNNLQSFYNSDNTHNGFGVYDNNYWKYDFHKGDVDIYSATDFVHAALEDNQTRAAEEVSIILEDPNPEEYVDPKTGRVEHGVTSASGGNGSGSGSGSGSASYSYSVRRGQSVLYDTFKTWRQLSLLENSVLLNRLTKSAITRVIGIEVGDMPKEKIQDTLQRFKVLVEQKSALNVASNLQEYTASGAYENNIYVPIYNGKGNITTTNIGGDTDTNVNGLGDIDYFLNKLYAGLKIPKQYLADTDDATGFNGGTSLAIVSSRYAKTVMRIQTVLLQAITDLVNILLFDRGFNNYINKFELHITAPTTQEQLDRQEQKSGQVQLVRDIMDLVSEIEDPAQKFRILKALIKELNIDPEVSEILQEEIDKLDKSNSEGEGDDDFGDDDDFGSDFGGGGGDTFNMDFGSDFGTEEPIGSAPPEIQALNEPSGAEETSSLPDMADLGVDFTDNT